MTTFADLGLSAKLLKALEKTKLQTPTPIQAQAIPHIMQGRDLMGLAQTGTGKTAAFGLPLLHRLLDIGHPPGPKNVRALILAPTRELTLQIKDNLEVFTKGTPVKVTMVVGGASLFRQAQALAKGSDVLVATPGRLIDLLERGDVKLDQCGYLVLDEADHMLDMGFIHSLRKIAKHIPLKRQTLLFSATMPKDISEIADTYLRDPVRVQVTTTGKTADKVTQGVHFLPNGDKARVLEDYLKKHPGEQALVFGRTKHGSEKLMKLLAGWGFKAGSIHGNKSQSQRDRTLTEFRNGELDVLVATDVAARGIDIPTVRHVYNFDMPNVPENYVHRIGRTARAGAEGSSVSFCAPAEMGELQAIEKLLKKPLPILGGAPWAADIVAATPKPGQNRGQRPARPQGGRPQAAKPAGSKPQGARPAAKPKPMGGGNAPRRSDGGKPAGQRRSS
ncbi:DEAD/DEAH box helicase [Pseudorhodobacter sp. MZDSW-24AT]|uniref:DEAD/DEAH box helicase n=1 Tax=Pseudorhodobacter sp. MZDSW-24AT TaxID=2052957 RepID=UPI000C1EE7BF|nr:DEAD/DEAH box helicase [Pseudorhodobacter sp. MZDSW-24AT]PJF09124.1 DEAD/DEAH box helicase [Pseudorhodobacter sp. MZDSW-24AT]